MPSARKQLPIEEINEAANEGYILEQRRLRTPWPEIAKHLGVSVRWCHVLYRKALTAYPSQMAEEYRQEELTLADDAVRGLLDIARGSPEIRTKNTKDGPIEYEVWPTFKDRIEAWTAIARWSEHKTKIFGGYAPTQINLSMESIQAEIDKLMVQMEAMDQKELEQ